jgi:hypothetical protein
VLRVLLSAPCCLQLWPASLFTCRPESWDRALEECPGLVGTLLARAEAQVLRLSMLYALLDGTATIRTEHLYAALALWEYVEASVTYIFGTSVR